MIDCGGGIGIAIGDYRGTAGCLAIDDATGYPQLISASHVITSLGKEPAGRLVYANNEGLIGAVCRDYPSIQDVGCVTLKPDVMSPNWRSGNGIRWEYRGISTAGPDQKIWKIGYTTNATEGYVNQTDLTVRVSPTNDGNYVYYTGITSIRDGYNGPNGKFVRPGDSGSAAVDRRNRVVGIIIGRNENETYMVPINTVLETLKLRPYPVK